MKISGFCVFIKHISKTYSSVVCIRTISSASVRLILEYTGSLSSGIRLLDNRRTLKLERVKNTYFSIKSSLSIMRVTTIAHVERVETLSFRRHDTDLHFVFPFFKWLSTRILSLFDIPFRAPSYFFRDRTHSHVTAHPRAHFTRNAPLLKRFRSISSQLYFTQSHSS